MSTKGIYRFQQDCGRSGELAGIFVATDTAIMAAYGKTAWFCEVLGKHSEIDVELSPQNLSLITDRQTPVQDFEDFGMATGVNPLDYLPEEEEEE